MANTATETKKKVTKLKEHIVEIISDSGEGAQRAGQTFGGIAAKMGNGMWTVEIIPAEIQPPARSREGASGNRIRIGSTRINSAGNDADLVVAFNEQVLWSRKENLSPGCTIILEDKWRHHKDPKIVTEYVQTYDQLVKDGYKVVEVPMEVECLKVVQDAKRGKNMFVVGLLCSIYSRDLQIAKDEVSFVFRHKGEKVIAPNIKLLESGYNYAEENIDIKYEIPSAGISGKQLVMNGNVALALGVQASGMDVCAMYPITPATSASHYLSEIFHHVGGIVHQSEDEIAACAVAIGASYAGKCAVTITSGPGLSLKSELTGLSVMAEIPLVLVDVQRGGPSTGQPTKVEQSDLMQSIYGTHGDAPRIVMAPATIEDCFYSVITARQIAETFRTLVIVLTDANLATGQTAFPRPEYNKEWVCPPFDQSPITEGSKPYDWDPKTGLSKRFIPGQKGGIHTLTGLAHDSMSRVAYAPHINQEGNEYRSLKLAAFQKTLKTPEVFGDASGGDMLVIGWGSTKGAIEEAVEQLREEGRSVSSIHLKFIQPLASGIKEIMQKYKKVICVEINYSDDPDHELINDDTRRYSSLATILRSRYLIDIDCWSRVPGQPLKPVNIANALRERLPKK